MRTLQNNFTTPEQSKRLLELGVPIDSADCFLLRTHTKGDTFIVEVLHDELYSKKDKFTNILEYLPCWSVGRLIEIVLICASIETRPFISFSMETGWFVKDNIEYMMSIFENYSKIYMDFSKLEE